MAEPKTKETKASVDDFVKNVADPVRKADSIVILEIMRRLTGEKGKMWGPSIVGFVERPIKYADGHEAIWPHVAFSPRKQGMTLYVINGTADDYMDLFDKLGKHTYSKGCLYIKKLSDVDQSVLEAVITRSIAAVS